MGLLVRKNSSDFQQAHQCLYKCMLQVPASAIGSVPNVPNGNRLGARVRLQHFHLIQYLHNWESVDVADQLAIRIPCILTVSIFP